MDSSAAAIAAQGLLRLGRYLKNDRYWQAGLTVCDALFEEPYLSADPEAPGPVTARRLSPAERLGSHSRQATAFRAAKPACGAIITRAKLALYLLRIVREQTLSDLLE